MGIEPETYALRVASAKSTSVAVPPGGVRRRVPPSVSDPVPRLLGWCSGIEQLQGPFTALPMIIYNWAGEAKAEFKTALAPAAIIVLMAITFLCNGVAVFLRNRYDKR